MPHEHDPSQKIAAEGREPKQAGLPSPRPTDDTPMSREALIEYVIYLETVIRPFARYASTHGRPVELAVADARITKADWLEASLLTSTYTSQAGVRGTSPVYDESHAEDHEGVMPQKSSGWVDIKRDGPSPEMLPASAIPGDPRLTLYDMLCVYAPLWGNWAMQAANGRWTYFEAEPPSPDRAYLGWTAKSDTVGRRRCDAPFVTQVSESGWTTSAVRLSAPGDRLTDLLSQGGYLAQDRDGVWFIYEEEPQPDYVSSTWVTDVHQGVQANARTYQNWAWGETRIRVAATKEPELAIPQNGKVVHPEPVETPCTGAEAAEAVAEGMKDQRKTKIAYYLMRGFSIQQIAALLRCSLRSVERDVAQLKTRLRDVECERPATVDEALASQQREAIRWMDRASMLESLLTDIFHKAELPTDLYYRAAVALGKDDTHAD